MPDLNSFFLYLIQTCLTLEVVEAPQIQQKFFSFFFSFLEKQKQIVFSWVLTSLVKGGVQTKIGKKVRKLLLFCYFGVVDSLATNCQKEEPPTHETFTQSFFWSLTLIKWNKKCLCWMSKSRNLNSDPELSSSQLKLRIFVVTYIFIKPTQRNFGKKLYFSSKVFQNLNMLHSN